MLRRILAFLRATPGTIRGVLTAADKLRVVIAAVSSGVPASIAAAILGLVGLPAVGSWLTVATIIATFAVESVRRLNHDTPPPAPPR